MVGVHTQRDALHAGATRLPDQKTQQLLEEALLAHCFVSVDLLEVEARAAALLTEHIVVADGDAARHRVWRVDRWHGMSRRQYVRLRPELC